jgi:hypothetical protein
MPSLHTPSIMDAGSAPRVPSFGAASQVAAAGVHPDSRSIGKLAIAGLFFAFIAANLVCFSPRWYSGSLLSLAWQSLKMVFLAAATGAAVVRMLWGLLAQPPSASSIQIARTLSASWVFLPCIVLLYEADSISMLALAAAVSCLMALGLRVLLPVPMDGVSHPIHRPVSSVLPSLDGLPPADSPVVVATCIAVCAEATVIFVAVDLLALAALPLCAAVFLFTWRWSAHAPRMAKFWIGARTPLWQSGLAIVLTGLCLIPFSVSHRGAMWGLNHSATPAAKRSGGQEDSSAGYAGIILYPPPLKKQLVAPMLHDDSFHAGVLTRPMMIPFDGAYWYFKAPSSRPGVRAHIARAKPTDVNVRSTDRDPLTMEAHQALGVPIDLAHCGEIDLAITNADTRPGEIDMALMLEDSTMGGHAQFVAPQPVLSSQAAQLPPERQPLHETLRFHLPAKHTLQKFDRITVLFLPTPGNRARAGAKISIDSFELLPRP